MTENDTVESKIMDKVAGTVLFTDIFPQSENK